MPLSTAAFPCCRDHDLFALVEEHPQRIQRTPGDEAYWFGWDSSFDGKAYLGMPVYHTDAEREYAGTIVSALLAGSTRRWTLRQAWVGP
jgi:hypothetical protein